MRYTKTDRAGGIVSTLVLAWVAVFLVLVTTQVQHWDADIFWALRAGRWILSNWKVPLTDPFSYTFAGHEWVDFTWGFQVIAHLFFTRLGGWTGLYILQLLITLAVFGVLFFNIRLLSGRRYWLIALLCALVLACALPRLFIRPHLFGFLFISLYLLILNVDERRDAFWPVFLILPFQVLWVNIHSSAILGVFIVWAYASGEFIDVFIRVGFKGFPAVFRRRRRLIALAVLAPPVMLINPYGLKLAVFPFIHQSGVNADALRHIAEWSSLPLKEVLLYFYPAPVNYFSFRMLFYMALGAMALNWRRLKTRDIMLLCGAAYMGITHVRWVGQFAFFAAPVAAFNLREYLGSRSSGALRPMKWAGLGLAILTSVFMGLRLGDAGFRHNLGIGLRTRNYPLGTVRFMKERGLRGNIYNAYVFGGYLIYEYPEQKVFIDGRTPTVYSPAFFWESRHVTKKKWWEKVAGGHGITMALVKLDRPLCNILYDSLEWTAVAFDDVSALYLKKDSGYDKVIDGYGISFTPCAGKKKYELPREEEGRVQMKEELKRVMRSIHDGKDGLVFARPHRLMGLLEGELDEKGHRERAVEELMKAASAAPAAYVYNDLGLALGKAKRYDEAIEAFRTSIDMDSGFKRAYLGLGLVYYDRKDYERAAKWLKKYVVLAGDNAEALGHKTLGMAEFRLGRFMEAKEHLGRAAFLFDDRKERAEAEYYMGNALFEEGLLVEGARYYEQALSDDPGYRKVYENLVRMLDEKKEKDRAEALVGVLKNTAKKGAKSS